MSGKALNKQEMDSIDLAKFVFAFAVIHIHDNFSESIKVSKYQAK